MSDVPLAHKYSAETYDQALSNLIERWKQENGERPIKYSEAAVGMDKSTVSVALKFLAEIGLLDSPKAGSYNVPEEVIDYKTKMGEVQREAKQKVKARISDYVVYSEATFFLNVNDFTLEELVEEVAGSSEVAASQDELSNVERSLRILAELGFLEIDEEGNVAAPNDPSEESDSSESSPGEASVGQPGEEPSDQAPTSTVEENTIKKEDAVQIPREQEINGILTVDVDVSMDMTEMDNTEVREKLEIINEVFGEE